MSCLEGRVGYGFMQRYGRTAPAAGISVYRVGRVAMRTDYMTYLTLLYMKYIKIRRRGSQSIQLVLWVGHGNSLKRKTLSLKTVVFSFLHFIPKLKIML
jgi:hypothetical protein